MDYEYHYDRLIEKARNRIINGYKEAHHIIPRCIKEDNSKENIVNLTAREHYIAHYLLYKMYKDTEHAYKLISAFRYMTVDSHGGNRASSKDFDWMRREYSKNHPMKQQHIALKTSNGLKQYYQNETAEQKGVRSKTISESLKRFHSNKDKSYYINYITRNKDPEFRKKISLGLTNYYKNETNEQKELRLTRMNDTLFNSSSNEKRKKSIQQYVSALTEEELNERMNKSLRNCDHVKRGNSISNAKKGKTTNQQEIMGKRYASMTNDEFELFLNEKSTRTHNRMIKLRNKYL